MVPTAFAHSTDRILMEDLVGLICEKDDSRMTVWSMRVSLATETMLLRNEKDFYGQNKVKIDENRMVG